MTTITVMNFLACFLLIGESRSVAAFGLSPLLRQPEPISSWFLLDGDSLFHQHHKIILSSQHNHQQSVIQSILDHGSSSSLIISDWMDASASAWPSAASTGMMDVVNTAATTALLVFGFSILFSLFFLNNVILEDEALQKSDLWKFYQAQLAPGETLQQRPDLLAALMKEYTQQVEDGVIPAPGISSITDEGNNNDDDNDVVIRQITTLDEIGFLTKRIAREIDLDKVLFTSNDGTTTPTSVDTDLLRTRLEKQLYDQLCQDLKTKEQKGTNA